MQDLLGKKLNNRYEVMRPLGEGGMGKVYVARDRRFGKEVVVKVPTMESGDGEYKDRFMREIASLAKLEHAHIVPTQDWGEVEGIPYLVLRYLGGGSLRNRITDEKGYYRPMGLEGLTQWLPQIASALDFIHGKGWVHRDLKPDNILFDESGSPYLADFGIAKALEGNVMGVKTTTGAFIGTPQYMAPEMHLGKGIGPKADQFGLAVLVYESLAGKIPFEGATPTAIFVEVMQGKAKPIHEIVAGISEEKSGVLSKAISKDPRARYATCAEFAAAMLGDGRVGGVQPTNTPVKTPSSVQIPSTRLATPVRPEIPATMQVKAQQPSGIEQTKLVTPKRQDIPPTRMETPEKKTRVKNDIPATRISKENDEVKEVGGVTKLAQDTIVGNGKPYNSENLDLYERQIRKKSNQVFLYAIVGILIFIALYGLFDFLSSKQTKKNEDDRIAKKLEKTIEKTKIMQKMEEEAKAKQMELAKLKLEEETKVKQMELAKLKLEEEAKAKQMELAKLKLEEKMQLALDKIKLEAEAKAKQMELDKMKLEEEANFRFKKIETLFGHTSMVTSASFSPDGKRIVSGSAAKTINIKIWDASSRRLIQNLDGHTGVVNSVSFSPDGKRIVSGSDDKTIKIWDASSWRLIQTLKGHTGVVNSVSFSPDGKRIVSGSLDKTLKIWDPSTGQEIQTLKGHTSMVISVSFSPDGKRIVSGSFDKTLKIWDTLTGKEIQTLKGHTSTVRSVSFSPDGKRIASGCDDNTLKIWDAATGQEIWSLKGQKASFSPDGKRIVSGNSGDKTIKIWDAATGQEIQFLEGQNFTNTSASFSPDGKRIVSGSGDNTIKIWSVD